MNRTKDTGIPEFKTLEEEKEYWEARGPLAERREGRINKPRPRQKRSSFLAVRLTGDELTRLRDLAAKQRVGPSTFARLVLTQAIEHQGKLPRVITLDELKDMVENNLPEPIKDKAENLAKATAIGDPDNPSFLIIDSSQMKESEEFVWSLITALLSMMGVQVVTPKDDRYKEMRDIVKREHGKEVIRK